MAANYLQRIAIVGSRTVGAAKPAVVGPPDMPGSALSAGPPVLANLPPSSDRIEDPSRPLLDLERPPQVRLEPVERAVESTPSSVTEPAPDLALPQAGGSAATGDAARVAAGDSAPEQPTIPQALQPASTSHLRPETRILCQSAKRTAARRRAAVNNHNRSGHNSSGCRSDHRPAARSAAGDASAAAAARGTDGRVAGFYQHPNN